MIHSPSERNGRYYADPKPGASSRFSQAGAGSQSFGPSSTAFPRYKQGAGREVEHPGYEPVPIWDPVTQGKDFSH